jgi:hypothetical protein
MDTFTYPEWYRGPRQLQMFITVSQQIILHKQGKTSYMHGILIRDPLPDISIQEMATKMMEAKQLLDKHTTSKN